MGVKFKITNSVGVYDMYKAVRRNGWYNIGRPLKEHEFYVIVRSINKLLAENIASGKEVVFPVRMGRLELRKYPTGVKYVDGKLKNSYPIDWSSTNQLWAEDKEERQKHTLLRYESPLIYQVKYCKEDATYENKMFYQFKLHKKVRKKLQENIISGKTDTLW